MKTLDELGISKTPWNMTYLHHNTASGDICCVEVNADDTTGITSFDIDREQFSAEEASANANLIAAAPMLYEALRKLVDACGEVGYKDGGTAACFESERHLYDAIWKAESALAAASGESEVAK